MMINSELGDVKTQSKRQVQKIELNFEDGVFHGKRFKLKFFPWIRTGQLKKILLKQKFHDKHKHLTQNDIRLFCKNIELNQENKSFFDFYKIEAGSTVIITLKNSNENHLENGMINPYQIFQVTPNEIKNLLLNIQTGLNSCRKPKLASEGTSGTYFLENNQKKIVAVYKPYDEQPYTPNNPRGFAGELGSYGIRKGILSGQSATREVAAYLLDSVKHFHEVPATTYVQFYHPSFCYKQFVENNPIVSNKECDLKKYKTKHGSLQEFVEYMDVVGNLGARQFDMNEVHKIAILDLRILNCDRNEANILVIKKLVSNSKGGTNKLTNMVPIDHGLSFPDNFQIYDHQIVWMGYKQSEMPLSEKSLQFIENIDPIEDCKTLKEKLGFREICLRNFRLAEIFLKKMARAGFTLYEIGKFAYRVQDSDWQSQSEDDKKSQKKPVFSQLQKLVHEAQVIYFTVRDNGIKSTIELQIQLIKHRKQQENLDQQKNVPKQISSQEERLGTLMKKRSKINQTSIEKKELESKSKSKDKVKIRNISLPNLKKKISNIRDRRITFKKRKTKEKQEEEQHKFDNQKWGDIFFHYFQQILQRFIVKKLQIKKKATVKPQRGRLFSQNIQL